MKQISTDLIEIILIFIFIAMMTQCSKQSDIADELKKIRFELEKGSR